MRSSRIAAVASLALYAALLLGSRAAEAAETIEIEVGTCKAGIQLSANDAPLSKVLDRLAETLHLRIDAERLPDRIVNVRLAGMAPDVIAGLLSSHEQFM